jgi:hypothetical protein
MHINGRLEQEGRLGNAVVLSKFNNAVYVSLQ